MEKPVPVELLKVRHLGMMPYQETLDRMLAFTADRQENTTDELWLLEHPPVYTQGTSCDSTTIGKTSIPLVKTDRGGQITYHGPGQLIAYILSDLRRRHVGIRSLVGQLEALVIDLLSRYDIVGDRRDGAPGVYVDGSKVAALGLRVRRGCCYHGLSLNVDMDLSPFENIHPCGFEGLRVTRLADLGVGDSMSVVERNFVKLFVQSFRYTL